MASRNRVFDKKWLLPCLISLLCSLLFLRILPVIQSRCQFTEHVTFNYYITQLRIILPTLPLTFFIFSVLPLRRKLNYGTLLNRFSPGAFALTVFCVSLIISNLVSLLFYDHIPQGDAVVSFYQAKILASGNLWAKIPPHPEFFLSEMVSRGTKWFSMVQMGHSFLLVPFLLLRIPWLFGPLLGSCSLVLFFFFVKNSFDDQIAKEATLLLLLSPMFLFISSSFLNQNSSLFLILISLFFLSLTIRGNGLFPFLSGIFAGLAFVSRSTVALFIPGYLILLALAQKNRLRSFILFSAGFLPAFSLQFLLNTLYTGNPFRFAYTLHPMANLHAIGFGAAKGMPTFGLSGHSLLKALINLLYNTFAFSLHLFGWPLLSLLFIPFAFRRWTQHRWVVFSLAVIVSSIIFFALYWFHGISPMGPKYYFEISPFLVLLTVLGIRRTGLRPLAAILICTNILVYIPCALKPFNKAWGTNNRCYNEVRHMNLQNALVFIKDLPGETEYERTINRHNYLSVAFRNHPKIEQGAIIYAKFLNDEENLKLMHLYRDRDAFLFEYTTPRTAYHLLPYCPNQRRLEAAEDN
jgi:hypothetical protein